MGAAERGAAGRTFLVMMGAPGAGKGTQAKLLAEKLGLCQLSTGDLFREAIRERTEIGRAVEEKLREGVLVEDATTLQLVRQELGRSRCSAGAVLDGFPRTLGQAEGLESLLGQLGERLRRVIVIEVAEDEIVRRLSSRWVCEDCGRPISGAGADAGVGTAGDGGRCRACGGRLVQRPDDRPETVRRRLKVYHDQTAPLLDWYRKKGLLRQVPGDGGVAGIQERILREAS